MKEFLLLFRGGDALPPEPTQEEKQAHSQDWMQWMGGLAEQGKFVAAQPLNATGKQVAGLNKSVTDGPFMEGKEMVGGYLICRAADYEEAVEIAKGCPKLKADSGQVEVREIQEMKM